MTHSQEAIGERGRNWLTMHPAGRKPRAFANAWRGSGPKQPSGACPNQAFLPMTDEVIEGHLRGRHTIGVYPIRADDTCRFLAADFDRKTWRRDAEAFLGACRSKRIPAALERSRSGDGGHAIAVTSRADSGRHRPEQRRGPPWRQWEPGACHMSSYRHEIIGRSELARRACRGTTSADSPDSGPAPEVWRASQASGPDRLPPGREPGVGVARRLAQLPLLGT